MNIEGERIRLRPFELDDVAVAYAYTSGPEVMSYLPEDVFD